MVSLHGHAQTCPARPSPDQRRRSDPLPIGGREIEFTEGFTDLHTRVYEDILDGKGPGIEDARGSIELVYRIRTSGLSPIGTLTHPIVLRSIASYVEQDDMAVSARGPAMQRIGAHAYFKHKSAYVDPPCEIGEGTKIWHFCHIQRDVRIGRNCVFGQNCNVAERRDHRLKCEGPEQRVYLYRHDDRGRRLPRSFVRSHQRHQSAVASEPTQPVREDGAAGEGARSGRMPPIVCGITIGRYAFVGAGAVVAEGCPRLRARDGGSGEDHRVDEPPRTQALLQRRRHCRLPGERAALPEGRGGGPLPRPFRGSAAAARSLRGKPLLPYL